MATARSRLLALLSILQTPREWSGAELAERLEVSRRTVRRDIDRLRGLGYPVEATMGVDGGYRLGAGATMPPLLLDDDEAVAITLGLRTATGNAVHGIEEASLRALAKLEQVLPPRLRHRIASLAGATAAVPGYGPPVDPEILTLIARAITNDERLRFVYQSLDGTESRRAVEPNRLVVAFRRWYLVAYDTDRDDWRIFRVDRIADPWSMRGRTPLRELPPPNDAAAFVESRLLALAPTFRATATLHTSIEMAAPSFADGAAQLEPIDADRCRLTSHADTLEWLAFRLFVVGCEFEVHEPPELIEYLRTMGARVLRGTGTAGSRSPAPGTT